MDKKDIINEYNRFLRKFNLTPEEFVLGAGGACLMYGLRKTTDDMDTDVSSAMFDKMLKSGKYTLKYFGEIEVLEYNANIDIHRRLRVFETRTVDGVCCYSPKELLTQKLFLNRPKDQSDIAKLQKLILEESVSLAKANVTHTSTPEELLKWMDSHLTYKGENKGYLRTPKQVVEDGIGHCWETTELENSELTSMGYVCQTLFLANNNLYNESTVTHSTLIYKDKHNKYYWFEWAWYKQQGIHGPYAKLGDLLTFIRNTFIKQHKSIYAAKLSAVGPIALTTEVNYISETDSWNDVLQSTSLESLSLVPSIALNRIYTEW